MDSSTTAVAAAPANPVARKESVILVRLDGSIASWDQAAREIFGRDPVQVLGLPLCALFSPEFHDAVDGLWRATPSDPLCVLARGRDGNGLCFETELTASRTLAYRNGDAGYSVIVRDLTEERAAAAALSACTGARDSATAVGAVREALADWVPLVALTLRLRQGARLRPATGASGSSQALFPVARDGRTYGTLNAVFSEPRAVTPRVMRVLNAVAERIGPSLAQTLELEEKSRTIGQLEQVDRLEKEFLALITHDMRTPLAVIAGLASNLRDKWDELPDAERLEELDAILRNGRSLTRLVEQDLELALVDAGQLSCEIAPFDVASDLNRIATDFARVAGATLSVQIERPLPLVDGDAQRNAQVLANLLSNAVKFAPQGSLTEVHACRHEAMVHVSVRDYGRGLSRAEARKLFRKFSRLGSNGHPRPPGSGLGLYLSKAMVEAQGGRIWVDSTPGEGSTFTYTLPVSQAGC
jgi:PAS domain S-box-containing protein